MSAPRKKSPVKTQSGKKGWSKKHGEPVLLPSGETALLKRPGVEVFLADGIIPDSLAPLVQAQIAKAKTGREVNTSEIDDAILQDPKKVADLMRMLDNSLLACVIEPKVQRAPENSDDRRDDVFYPDEIEMEDKLFIFNYAIGGTRDWERFRAETPGAVAGLESVAGVPLSSE